MKNLIVLSGLLLAFNTVAHAQAKKECSKEVLKCEFFKRSAKGEKIVLGSEEKAFETFTSVYLKADACTLAVFSDVNKDDTMMIRLDDKSLTVDIDVVDRQDGLQSQRDAGASFKIMKNATFYYQYDGQIASCILTDAK